MKEQKLGNIGRPITLCFENIWFRRGDVINNHRNERLLMLTDPTQYVYNSKLYK